MSGTKLIVLQKKISKFLKGKKFFGDWTFCGSPSCEEGLPRTQQPPPLKKLNPAASLWSLPRMPPRPRAVRPVRSYLDFSTRSTAEVAGTATLQTTSDGKSEGNPIPPPGIFVAEAAFAPFEEAFVEVQEQSLYTNEESPIRSYTALKRKREEEEKAKTELPPAHRCRLSCPLPPPEFRPPEKSHFIPGYRPPTARFAAPPSAVRRRPGAAHSHTDLKMESREVVPKNPPAIDDEYQQFVPRSSRKTKSYIKVKNKSQLYPRSEEEPRMKALMFEPVGLTLSCEMVRAPTEIFKDEVLIQVSHSGVSGHDYLLTEGRIACGDSRIIPGREISGTVYAAGKDVRHVAKGDNVAVDPFTACSVCRFCSRGLCSACLNEGLNNSIGTSKNGGWAEFVVVKKSQVHKVPEALGLDQAALLLPLSCVLSAMSKLRLFNGMTIFIQGLGLSGCLWASLLHSRGYRNVLVTDKSARKRRQFESLKLDYAFVPVEDLRKHAADVVIECTGSPISIEKAFSILNPKGQMCFFGKPNPVTEVRCIPYDIIQREITIFGTSGNAFSFAEAVEVAASLGSRYLDLEKLGVGIFEPEQYREAFHLKKSDQVNKVIFNFGS